MKTSLPEPEIFTPRGKPVSVIVPTKAYKESLERLEDAEDVAWLKRLHCRPRHYRLLADYSARRWSA